MSTSTRLKTQIENVRQMSQGLLQAFDTPEKWVHQVDPNANHALWFAGHMGVSDNFFISMVDPDKRIENKPYEEKFGMGSVPTSRAADYPPVEEVLEFMNERRATLLAILADLTDEDLARTLPEGTPEMWSDVASVFETIVWHESLHAGQVSIARRSLGHAPLFSASAEEATA